MITEGWIPTGGATYATGGEYLQAMWRPPMPDNIHNIIERTTESQAIRKQDINDLFST
jgi:hypothetical protein